VVAVADFAGDEDHAGAEGTLQDRGLCRLYSNRGLTQLGAVTAASPRRSYGHGGELRDAPRAVYANSPCRESSNASLGERSWQPTQEHLYWKHVSEHACKSPADRTRVILRGVRCSRCPTRYGGVFGCSEALHARFGLTSGGPVDSKSHMEEECKNPAHAVPPTRACASTDPRAGRRRIAQNLRAISSNRHLIDRICFGFQENPQPKPGLGYTSGAFNHA
jgi:hypothetical protein